MLRLFTLVAGLAALACWCDETRAREPIYDPTVPQRECDDCRADGRLATARQGEQGRFDPLCGFLFRRYTGVVEMQDKTFYPPGYHGQFYFRGWKPDWIYPNPPSPERNCAECLDPPVIVEEEPTPRESRRPATWGASPKRSPRISRLPK